MVRCAVPLCLQTAVQLQVFLKKQLNLIKFIGLVLLMNTVKFLSPKAEITRKKKSSISGCREGFFFPCEGSVTWGETQLISIRQVFRGVCSSSQLFCTGHGMGKDWQEEVDGGGKLMSVFDCSL